MLFAAEAMNICKEAWMKVYEVKKDRMTLRWEQTTRFMAIKGLVTLA